MGGSVLTVAGPGPPRYERNPYRYAGFRAIFTKGIGTRAFGYQLSAAPYRYAGFLSSGCVPGEFRQHRKGYALRRNSGFRPLPGMPGV